MGKRLFGFFHQSSFIIIQQCDGKEISWSHLMELYKTNRARDNPGLALLPKLKYEHVYLTSYSKMRVDLAAQVGKIHTYVNVQHACLL